MDLGDLGSLIDPSDFTLSWHDHGQGLLCTILKGAGIEVDIRSTRSCPDWDSVAAQLYGYHMLLLNVRSYNFNIGLQVARLFKSINPRGVVLAGGMHATVAPEDMTSEPAFDHICQGSGEKIIVDLARDPSKFPRLIQAKGAQSLADWPTIDRTLWPKPAPNFNGQNCWPLEGGLFGPSPMASVITNRVCPFSCSFCNEFSYIPAMGRRPVDQVIDELNYLDEKFGPLGSVVIHDSMFFQQPSYLEDWLEKYPRRARRLWPYWAAGRADTVRKWPDLFEALVRQTNWNAVSIGFESGSTNTLRMLNKECTAEDNHFTINVLNRIGDDFARQGKTPPYFWANIMWGIPGESREDALETMRMIRFMRHKWISAAHYTPYPGSVLGHQLIAEGKSLIDKNDHRRYANKAKATGVDYQFYNDLQAGKYDAEVNSKPWAPCVGYADRREKKKPHSVYVFGLTNGKKKLAYGESPEDALEVLNQRLTAVEMAEIIPSQVEKSGQRDMRRHLPVLG